MVHKEIGASCASQSKLFCIHQFRFPLFLALLLILLSLGGRQVLGQAVTATIQGTIVDPSKAPIQGASIVATDINRGTTFVATSDEAGNYKISLLPIGVYSLKVSAPGFAAMSLPPVTLVLNQVAQLNFQMRVGSISESITVSSEAPLLQTQTTMVSTLIDSKTNVSLPLANRNYVQLTLLAPGTITVNPGSIKFAAPIQYAGQPYVNGNRMQANNYLLDGMANTQQSDNLLAFSPSPDAIQEFNLIAANAPAEFGSFQGGIVSVSTKSGTNRFHGALWEFLRNDALNANSWYNDLLNSVYGSEVAPKTKLRWNMFGGTIGGPIVKDKLFFFAAYQGQRYNLPGGTAPFNAWTGPERDGDFGQLCTDPSRGGTFDQAGHCSGGQGQQIMDPFTANPIPFNNLAAYIQAGTDPQLTNYYNGGGSSVVQNVLNSQYYPSVSSLMAGSGAPGEPGIVNNYFYKTKTDFNADQGTFRMDWQPSQKDHVFGRYSRNQTAVLPFVSLPILANSTENDLVWNTVVDWTHVISPNVLNDFRAGVDWVQIKQQSSSNTPADFGATVGIAGATGLPAMGLGGSTGNGLRWSDTVIQVGDNLGITHGAHSWNMGFQFLRYRMNSYFAGGGGLFGNYGYSGIFTGSDTTDIYLGLVTQEAQYFTNAPPGERPAWGLRSSALGAYFQDDWKVRDNLTLNLGLRLQLNTPQTEAHGRAVNYDVATGQPYYPAGHPLPSSVVFPGLQPKASSNKALYNGYYGIGNWEPRIGFAFMPTAGGKLVIRGAYTISDFLEGTGNLGRPTQNVPFNLFIQRVNTCSFGQPNCTYDPTQLQLRDGIVPVLGNQFAGTRLNIWATDFRPSMSQQWNFSVQRIFAHNTTAQIAYVGQHGTHLVYPANILQKQLLPDGTTLPSPFMSDNPDLLAQTQQTFTTFTGGSQSYNSFQAVVQKRIGQSLQGQAAYTWSHCLTDAIGFYGGEGGQADNASAFWQNLYDSRAEWGSCFFDVTHNLTAYAVWNLPFGHGRAFGAHMNPIVNAVVGNWNVSPIYTWHGGFPLTILGDDHSGTNSRGGRADCNGAPRYIKKANMFGMQWFDPGVYSNSQAGHFGTCGVSTLRGPGSNNIDISVQKEFPIEGTMHVEFRSEFINALNHPFFDAPINQCSGAPGTPCAFGLGLGASEGERNIQFALKLYY